MSRHVDMDELMTPEDADAAPNRTEYARMRSEDEPALSTPTQSMRIRLRKQKSAAAGEMNAALRGSDGGDAAASPTALQLLDQSFLHPYALVDKVKKHMHLDKARCKSHCITVWRVVLFPHFFILILMLVSHLQQRPSRRTWGSLCGSPSACSSRAWRRPTHRPTPARSGFSYPTTTTWAASRTRP